MSKKILSLAVVVVIAAAFASAYLPVKPSYMNVNSDVQAFASEQEFKDYIENYADSSGYIGSSLGGAATRTFAATSNAVMEDGMAAEPAAFDTQGAKGMGDESAGGEASRVSGTNVQWV